MIINGLFSHAGIKADRFRIKRSKATKQQNAIIELQRIGSLPYKDPIKDTAVERKWVETFGGYERRVNTLKEHILSILFSPEYQLSDLLKLSKGMKVSNQNLQPTLQEFNAFKDVPKLDIP